MAYLPINLDTDGYLIEMNHADLNVAPDAHKVPGDARVTVV